MINNYEEFELYDGEIEEEIDFKDIENEEFKEIKNNKKLQKSDITKLVMEYNNGNTRVYDDIYLYYKPVLERWGIRNKNQDMAEDLLDFVLFNAVTKFSSDKKTQFDTFFWKCANNHVKREIVTENTKKRAGRKNDISLNKTVSYKDEVDLELGALLKDLTCEEEFELEELKMSINNLHYCLKDTEANIILKLIDNYTIKDISEEMGITSSGVCMVLKRLGKKINVKEELKNMLIG